MLGVIIERQLKKLVFPYSCKYTHMCAYVVLFGQLRVTSSVTLILHMTRSYSD